jgi:D-alanyl-D-alanine endopeptidase (penicillin-binding protein 7)
MVRFIRGLFVRRFLNHPRGKQFPVTYHLLGIQMSIGLRFVLIILVMGIGSLHFSEARAAEKHIANKSVAKKNATKPVASKSAAVNAKKQKTTKTTKTTKIVKTPKTAQFTRIVKIKKKIPAEAAHNPGKLSVQSGAALVVEQHSGGEVLFQKNADQIVPIASITKLMTAMVVLDSSPILDAPISITDDDVDYLRGSRSRLPVGSVISRKTALLLALMSSENRAAHALARHYPGGMHSFLPAMNAKAKELGMLDSRFEDPTGLTSNNVSTPIDLAKMVTAAHKYQLIRELTTTAEAKVEVAGQDIEYRNTNPLVKNAAWNVGLSKTGYISEAGKCLVMQARLAEKPVVIVLLDSQGSLTRVGDATRIKHWMDSIYTPPKMAIQTVASQKRGRNRS